MKRFIKEMNGGGETLFFDMVTDADILQVENSMLGGSIERWRVTVARYSPEILVEQLYYSPAGRVWMTGVSFYFDQEVLAGRLEISEVWRARGGLAILEDDDFFIGICEAVERWNTSVDQVSPIEDGLGK